MTRLIVGLVCFAVASSMSFTLNRHEQPRRQLTPATDVDTKLTEEASLSEHQLCDAILHKDASMLNRLVGPEYTLRVADIPQASLPRTIWIDNTLRRLQPESCEQHHVVARRLANDLAVVSLVWGQKGSTDGRDFSGDFYVVDFWKKRGGSWQIIARYSSPIGKPPDRARRQLPPSTDTDPQITNVLSRLEQELGEVAVHGFENTKSIERLVATEFTQRGSDAPERSLPRSAWRQPPSDYKINSLDEHYYAARRLNESLAVISLVLTQQESYNGRERTGEFYVVDIWKKSGATWRIIARYSSPITKNN